MLKEFLLEIFKDIPDLLKFIFILITGGAGGTFLFRKGAKRRKLSIEDNKEWEQIITDFKSLRGQVIQMARALHEKDAVIVDYEADKKKLNRMIEELESIINSIREECPECLEKVTNNE